MAGFFDVPVVLVRLYYLARGFVYKGEIGQKPEFSLPGYPPQMSF